MEQDDRADAHVPEQDLTSSPDLEAFRSALDAGPAGIWSWDLRANRIMWSTRLEDFSALAEDSVDGTLSLAPQDLPPHDGGVLAAIHKALQTREPCRLEYRLPPRSGREERWF